MEKEFLWTQKNHIITKVLFFARLHFSEWIMKFYAQNIYYFLHFLCRQSLNLFLMLQPWRRSICSLILKSVCTVSIIRVDARVNEINLMNSVLCQLKVLSSNQAKRKVYVILIYYRYLPLTFEPLLCSCFS